MARVSWRLLPFVSDLLRNRRPVWEFGRFQSKRSHRQSQENLPITNVDISELLTYSSSLKAEQEMLIVQSGRVSNELSTGFDH